MKVPYCPFCGKFPQHDNQMVDHECETLGIRISVTLAAWSVRRRPAVKPLFVAEQTEMKLPVVRSPKQLANDQLLCALASAELQEPVSAVVGHDARRHAMALKLIRAYTPDVTVDQIKQAAARYRFAWPTAEFTSNALAKWWTRFQKDVPGPKRPPTPSQRKEAVMNNIDRYFGGNGLPTG